MYVFLRDELPRDVAQRAGELARRAVALRAHRLCHLVVMLSTRQRCTSVIHQPCEATQVTWIFIQGLLS